MASLVLVGKPDCHLCHELHETAAEIARELGLVLEQKDLREDPDLERRYRLAIPVLLLDGREVARYRASADELRARLKSFIDPPPYPSSRRGREPL